MAHMYQIKNRIKNDRSYVSYDSEQTENKQPRNNSIDNREQKKYIVMNSQTRKLYIAQKMNAYASTWDKYQKHNVDQKKSVTKTNYDFIFITF